MRALALAGFLLPLTFVGASTSISAGGAGQKAAPKIDAAELYQTQCQPCHGPEGTSVLEGLSFSDDQWKHGTRLQDIVRIVTDGVEGTPMLPFKDKLTKDEILALSKLVRSYDKSLSTKKPASPKPKGDGGPAKKPVKKNG